MSDLEKFVQVLAQSINQQSLIKLVLSKYQGQESELQRLTIRPVLLRDAPHLSCLYHYKTRDITKNISMTEGIEHIKQLLNDFKNANLFTQEQELQLSISKKISPRC